jgi:Glyoxalase-like domain
MVAVWVLSRRSRSSGRRSWTLPTRGAWPSFTGSCSACGTAPGDEPPGPGQPDPKGQDWLILTSPGGGAVLAFQKVGELPGATWPDGPVPQQLHLDATVPTMADLDVAHERALALGARLLQDRSDDPQEPLRVYADPAGHPFCIIAAI